MSKKKKIYFKECFATKSSKEFTFEIYWKKHWWMPFKKLDGIFTTQERLNLLLTYAENYDVYVWDDVYGQFVSLSSVL